MIVRDLLKLRNLFKSFPQLTCHHYRQEVDEFRADDRPIIVDPGLIEIRDVLVEPEHDLYIPPFFIRFVCRDGFQIQVGYEGDRTELLAEFGEFRRIIGFMFLKPCILFFRGPVGISERIEVFSVGRPFLLTGQTFVSWHIGIVVIHAVFGKAFCPSFQRYQEMKIRTRVDGLLGGPVTESFVCDDDTFVDPVRSDEISQCRDIDHVPGIRLAADRFAGLDVECIDDGDVLCAFLQGFSGEIGERVDLAFIGFQGAVDRDMVVCTHSFGPCSHERGYPRTGPPQLVDVFRYSVLG